MAVGMPVAACTLSTSTTSSERSPLATLSLRPQERFAPCTALSSVAGLQLEQGMGQGGMGQVTDLSTSTPPHAPL